MTPLRTLVADIGHMGRSHALACHAHPGFEIVGLVNRSALGLPPELAGCVDVMCQITDDALHRAIAEDLDLSRHHRGAVRSLAVRLAADESVRTGQVVPLGG